MKISKGLIIGFGVVLAVVLLVSATYLIPLFLLQPVSVTPTTDHATQENTTTDNPTTSEQQGNPSQQPPQKHSEQTPPEPGPIIVLKPYHQTITSRGNPEFEIIADEAQIDQVQNKFTLTAIEALRFFGDNGEEIVVSGDRGFWQQAAHHLEVSGNVKGKIIRPDEDPVDITCQWLKYDQDKQLLTGGSDVVITHQHYQVTSHHLVLRPKINNLELSDNVVATIGLKALENQSIPLDEPVTITAENLVYNGEHNIIQFSGHPVVSSGKNRIQSKRIRLSLQHENRILIFDERCHMTLDLPADGTSEKSVPAEIKAGNATLDFAAGELRFEETVRFKQGNRSLEAGDWVTLLLDPDSRELFGGNASGNVRFGDTGFAGSAQEASWDPTTGIVLLSNNAILDNLKDVKVFGNQIQLYVSDRFYVVDGNARIEMLERPDAAEAAPVDTVTATPVENEPSENPGKPGKEPVNLFARFQTRQEGEHPPMIINTQKIEVDESEGRMICQGGVDGEQGTFRFAAEAMELQFDPRTREIINLVARDRVSMSDEDQVLTGGRFRYVTTTGTAEVWEEPVMWKGDGQIRADRFVYNENTGLLQMLGNVDAVTVLPEETRAPRVETDLSTEKQVESASASDPSNDRFIYLTAGNGTYDQVNETVEFQDDVKMRWGIWKTRSNSLRMELDPVTGELQGANALGDVEVHHESFTANGHSLTYTPETSILVLRGTEESKCRVTQGERGSQGDEIRFFVNENRFVIENGISVIMPSEMTGTLK